METYIKDLKLSPEVKTALSWCLGITKVSDVVVKHFCNICG